jgi:MtN3 and saliva related transmembrane protein
MKISRLFEEGGRSLSAAEILGIVAGVFTTFALVPQIMRVYKLKSAREISLLFNSAMLLGIIFWLVYGILLNLTALIVWNCIGIVLNGWLLFAKFRYGGVKTT